LEQARLVREMFTWVAVERLSLGKVTERLVERGIPSPTGLPRWDRATVRGILLNPAYMGLARFGKTRLLPRKTATRRPYRGQPEVPRREKIAYPTSPEEQEPIPVPAIVSGELFAAVAKQLAENRRSYREQRAGAEFLLGGLLVCHRCGGAYCGRRFRHAPGRDYVYYRCLGTEKNRHGGVRRCDNASLTGPRTENAVWSDVCNLLQDPTRLRRELERRLERPPPNEFDTGHQEASLAKIKRRIARLIDAYENGWLDRMDFEPRLRRAKEQLAREEELLAQQQRDQATAEELRLLVGEFDRFAAQMREGLAHADLATKRKLLRLLIKRIEVDADEIRIIYKVQPHPFVPSPARGILQDCLKCHSKAQGCRASGYPGKGRPTMSSTLKGLHRAE
jgi:site-specific DNA recombinase